MTTKTNPTNSDKNPTNGNDQNPQNQVDENAKFINNLLHGDNSPSKNLSVDENKLIQQANHLVLIKKSILQKQEEVNSSGRIGKNGKNKKLSSFEKAKLRNEVLELRNVKRELKLQISKLSKKVKASYKMNAQKSSRMSLRITARGEGYHRRNGGSINAAITKMVKAMNSDSLAALKAELSNLETTKGDTLLMRVLSKAPHNLQTKVVTNKEARIGYLQHFRSEIGATKKAPKGRGRRNK